MFHPLPREPSLKMAALVQSTRISGKVNSNLPCAGHVPWQKIPPKNHSEIILETRGSGEPLIEVEENHDKLESSGDIFPPFIQSFQNFRLHCIGSRFIRSWLTIGNAKFWNDSDVEN